MKLIALTVLIVMLIISAWAWRVAPAKKAADQLVEIWRVNPWGKQFYFDFFGLEIMLALWMLADAMSCGAWLLFAACTLAMPIFGAMPAALYWLVRGLW
jgi:hypothetical protein